MLLLGPKIALASEAASAPAAAGSRSDRAVSDLVARLAFVSRAPEPRHVQARERRAVIAVPAPSAISYGLRVPQDGELRLGMALPEETTQSILFQVQVQGQILLEQALEPTQAGVWHDVVLDLRPYGGASPAGGALAQAKSGRAFWEILQSYYPGSRIVRVYGNALQSPQPGEIGHGRAF